MSTKEQECGACGAPLRVRVDAEAIDCLFCAERVVLSAKVRKAGRRILQERRETDRLSEQALASRARLERTTVMRCVLDLRVAALAAIPTSILGVVLTRAAVQDLHGSPIAWVAPTVFLAGAFVASFVFVRTYWRAREAALHAVRAQPVREGREVRLACRLCGAPFGDDDRGLLQCGYCSARSLIDDAAFRAREEAAQGHFELSRRIYDATTHTLHIEIEGRLAVWAMALVAAGFAGGALTIFLGRISGVLDTSDDPATMLLVAGAGTGAAAFLIRTLDRAPAVE